MTLDEAWHATHPMPRNPSMDDRISWHEEHAEVCGCRPIPDTVRNEIRKRRGGKN